MLNFQIKNNQLLVIADSDGIELLKDCDNYQERENVIRENYYASGGEYDYKTADQIAGNLSEAPLFCSELDYCDNGEIHFYDDSEVYYFNDYMLNDFTIMLMMGEVVAFDKLG